MLLDTAVTPALMLLHQVRCFWLAIWCLMFLIEIWWNFLSGANLMLLIKIWCKMSKYCWVSFGNGVISRKIKTKSSKYTLANLTATPLRIEHFSVFEVSAQSAVSLSAFALESTTSKIFSTGSKIFQFAAQSPCSRIAVSVGSQCIRHQIDGDCPETALRTHGDCSTSLANARRQRCESCKV